jgi:hypothetical protein
MEEKEISIEESLNIMQGMVKQAQRKISEDGFLFIFWGWLVFLTAMGYYLMIRLEIPLDKAWMVWMLMPLGGIFTAIYSIRRSKKEKVKTYMDAYMGFVWTAFGLALTLTLTLGWKLQLNCYPVVIMLYGMATFITGGLIRFTPLIVCGILSFPISACAFFVTFENQVLLLALSLLVSYIIPGHWLRIKARQNGI